MTREEFIELIAPIAVKLRLEGSPIFPSVRIAQAILETGGKVNAWNNVVGYKVGSGILTPYWSGKKVSATTWEVYEGVRYDNVRDDFRAYDTLEDGFRDQDLLFQLPRYAGVRQAKTPTEQTGMLQRNGYATDPEYASKLQSIIRTHNLIRFDEEVLRMLEQLQVLQAQIEKLQKEVAELQRQASLPEVPEWAKAAVNAAVAAKIIDSPQGGSYDFYRILTVMHRRGLLQSK